MGQTKLSQTIDMYLYGPNKQTSPKLKLARLKAPLGFREKVYSFPVHVLGSGMGIDHNPQSIIFPHEVFAYVHRTDLALFHKLFLGQEESPLETYWASQAVADHNPHTRVNIHMNGCKHSSSHQGLLHHRIRISMHACMHACARACANGYMHAIMACMNGWMDACITARIHACKLLW